MDNKKPNLTLFAGNTYASSSMAPNENVYVTEDGHCFSDKDMSESDMYAAYMELWRKVAEMTPGLEMKTDGN